MLQTLPFNDHVAEYEAWFDQYPFVFQSEVLALREMIPREDYARGLEVGTGTGRFAEALGIAEAIEPANKMRLKAIEKGIRVLDAEAEHLPYLDESFDYVVMSFCISYFKSIEFAFKEGFRVLKPGGSLIVGFLDKESMIGKEYEARKPFSVFYKEATFYSPEAIITQLRLAGFKSLLFKQTLSHHLEEIKVVEMPKAGFGEGSFVVIKAVKKET